MSTNKTRRWIAQCGETDCGAEYGHDTTLRLAARTDLTAAHAADLAEDGWSIGSDGRLRCDRDYQGDSYESVPEIPVERARTALSAIDVHIVTCDMCGQWAYYDNDGVASPAYIDPLYDLTECYPELTQAGWDLAFGAALCQTCRFTDEASELCCHSVKRTCRVCLNCHDCYQDDTAWTDNDQCACPPRPLPVDPRQRSLF